MEKRHGTSLWLFGALVAMLIGVGAGYACYTYETAGDVRLAGRELLQALLALI